MKSSFQKSVYRLQPGTLTGTSHWLLTGLKTSPGGQIWWVRNEMNIHTGKKAVYVGLRGLFYRQRCSFLIPRRRVRYRCKCNSRCTTKDRQTARWHWDMWTVDSSNSERCSAGHKGRDRDWKPDRPDSPTPVCRSSDKKWSSFCNIKRGKMGSFIIIIFIYWSKCLSYNYQGVGDIVDAQEVATAATWIWKVSIGFRADEISRSFSRLAVYRMQPTVN